MPYLGRQLTSGNYLKLDDSGLINELKRHAPVQFNVYLEIKKQSPVPMKVSSLSTFCFASIGIFLKIGHCCCPCRRCPPQPVLILVLQIYYHAKFGGPSFKIDRFTNYQR